jgi:hypothetical protein
MANVVMEELPIGAESTVVPDSPSKDANSVLSTDDESAYHDDEEEGIEIDEVSTMIAVNDCVNPKQDPAIVVPVNNTHAVPQKKNNTKKKRLSSFLFWKKAKKSARAAPPVADEVPGLVMLAMSEDNVSSLAGSRIDENSQPGKMGGGSSGENPVFCPEKPALEVAVENVEPGAGVKREPVQEENSDTQASQSNEGKIVGQGESSGLTILGIENHEAPKEGKPNSVDPETNNEKIVDIRDSVHVSNTVPVTTDTIKSSTKRKSFRFLSKKDSKIEEQVAAPRVVTPPSSPPSTINVKIQAPLMPTAKHDPVEDVAVGIGRKWALFFRREKGEIDEDSDDLSRDDDVLSFAVPASDLSAADGEHLSSPVTITEGNLDGFSTEAPNDDSKPGLMQEEALATPEGPIEPVSLNEQTVSTEAKEISSTVEASKVAPINESLTGESPAELATEAAETAPIEPTASTSPSSPKQNKWGLFSNRSKAAIIIDSGIESDVEDFPQAVPLSDLPRPESSRSSNHHNVHVVPEIPDDAEAPSLEDKSIITVDTLSEGSASVVARGALAGGKEEEPKEVVPETAASIFTPWTVAMAALTGNTIQDTEGIEVSTSMEEKDIESKTKPTSSAKGKEATEEGNIVRTDNDAEKGGQLSASHSDMISRIFTPRSAAMTAFATVSAIQDSEGIEVSATEENKGAESDAISTKNMQTFSIPEGGVTAKADTSTDKETNSKSDAPKKLSSSKAGQESSVDPSDSVGMLASAMAFMSAVFINDTGDVEVAAGPEGATEKHEAAAVIQALEEDVSETKVSTTINTVDTVAAPEDNASSGGDDESFASSRRSIEHTNSPSSTGVIAQRQAHLATLAASIPTLDDVINEEAVSCSSSAGAVPKTSFKDKLMTIISRDIAANKKSAGEDSDGSSIKTGLKERYHDSSLIDEDDSVNDFFKQLDDESIGGETIETELIDLGDSAGYISSRTRCYNPSTCRFDDREFDRGYELKVCGAAAPACHGVNVQHEMEAKLGAFIESFDCGRSSTTVEGNSVYPGSEVASSEAALSGNGSECGKPQEAGTDQMKFLVDEFFQEASLDDSFWSALEDSTIGSASVHSGSIRKLRKLLDDSDYEDSIFNTVAGRDDEDTIESIGHEIVARPRYGIPSSPGDDITGSVSLLDNDSSTIDESKENADAAVKEIKESACVKRDDAIKVGTQKTDTKSSDKAVEDIKRAMATLKKYASLHGISEPELLWRIQEEHKKRRGWSTSMAEF